MVNTHYLLHVNLFFATVILLCQCDTASLFSNITSDTHTHTPLSHTHTTHGEEHVFLVLVDGPWIWDWICVFYHTETLTRQDGLVDL